MIRQQTTCSEYLQYSDNITRKCMQVGTGHQTKNFSISKTVFINLNVGADEHVKIKSVRIFEN